MTAKLGKGTGGSVYLGHDPVIDRPVAIKILNTDGNVAGRKQREQQFINEARAAGRLAHPHIVTVYDASSEAGTTYIAMEFLSGKDLDSLLSQARPFDAIVVAMTIKKIADALAYAHQNGVIHRDIKPANIFVLDNGEPKVLDFGIARTPNRISTENNLAPHTLFNNNILGTPSYMSPEQALGQQVSALTDIYSLGTVMYEMLTGQKAFTENNVEKLLQKIAKKSPTAPSVVDPKISKTLSAIVMKAMQKNPDMRYQDAGSMAQELGQFITRAQRGHQKRPSFTGMRKPPSQEHVETKPTSLQLSWTALGIAVLIVIGSLFR